MIQREKQYAITPHERLPQIPERVVLIEEWSLVNFHLHGHMNRVK